MLAEFRATGALAENFGLEMGSACGELRAGCAPPKTNPAEILPAPRRTSSRATPAAAFDAMASGTGPWFLE